MKTHYIFTKHIIKLLNGKTLTFEGSACGYGDGEGSGKKSKVTCTNCKRTKAYKEACARVSGKVKS